MLFVFKEQCLILLHKQWVSMESSDLNNVLLMYWLHLLLYHGNPRGYSCPLSSFYLSSSLLLSSSHLQCFKNKQPLLFFRNRHLGRPCGQLLVIPAFVFVQLRWTRVTSLGWAGEAQGRSKNKHWWMWTVD